jgi:hypothetical protein
MVMLVICNSHKDLQFVSYVLELECYASLSVVRLGLE